MKTWIARGLLVWLALTCVGAQADDSRVPLAQRRSAEQTLLTFPEWFLVHSPAEYARTLREKPSHDFPFLSHIGQLWSGYLTVTHEQFSGNYPSNPGYHVMILVLATSTTIEYGLRSAYENTFGRLSWAFSGSQPTAEDQFAARASQDYVDFIRQQPWYLFDFSARFKTLWTDVPLWGPGMLRKWERRYALSTEYLVKALYGKVIEMATRAAYDVAQMNTDVVIAPPPAELKLPAEVSVLKTFADGKELLSLPRYFDFRLAATALATQGAQFEDIAGNRGMILVTLWTPARDTSGLPGARVLFVQAIQTPVNTQRVGVLVSVGELSGFLRAAKAHGLQVEHVHDY